ncbi:hypothetical protein T10_11468 [Trichinella papuae]|uniref:Uncharacterized protein n=1 Tax=Trichinella papuae TaxID=268474 RepID=A0A0V1MUW0_9BILA|nr:hypothetical protein T10_11468 [Trichinella papuae]
MPNEQQSNKWCGKIASERQAIYFSQLQEKLKAKIDFTKECSKERQFIDGFAFEQMKVVFIKKPKLHCTFIKTEFNKHFNSHANTNIEEYLKDKMF